MFIFSLSGLAHGVPVFIKALSFLCKRYSKYRPAITDALLHTLIADNSSQIIAALDLLASACPAIELMDAFL